MAEEWDGRSLPGGRGPGLTGLWAGPRCGTITIPISGPLMSGRLGISAGVPIRTGTAGIMAIIPIPGMDTGITDIIFPDTMADPAGP